MTGYNHDPDCLCGWCVGGWRNHGRRAVQKPRAHSRPSYVEIYESYVNPNARCPVCGADVFFYQSPFGGRVYFDELGPPWDKHPCTDNTPERLGRGPAVEPVASGKAPPPAAQEPTWKRAGWIPVLVEAVDRDEAWWMVRGQALTQTGGYLLRFVTAFGLSSTVGTEIYCRPIPQDRVY